MMQRRMKISIGTCPGLTSFRVVLICRIYLLFESREPVLIYLTGTFSSIDEHYPFARQSIPITACFYCLVLTTGLPMLKMSDVRQ